MNNILKSTNKIHIHDEPLVFNINYKCQKVLKHNLIIHIYFSRYTIEAMSCQCSLYAWVQHVLRFTQQLDNKLSTQEKISSDTFGMVTNENVTI